MTPIITRLLLFLLIPVGIFLLIQGIKLIRKFVGGAVILDIPLIQTDAQITIPKSGGYAIWQKGRQIGRMAASMPVPDIYNEEAGQRLQLELSGSTVRTNDGSNGRIRMFTFYAPAGQYKYHLSPDSATKASWSQQLRTDDRIDRTKCFIEVKEYRSAGLLVAGILILILSAFCIIAGITFTTHFK